MLESPLMRGLSLLAAVTTVAACTPDFDEVWLVKDLRILALRAEPPEVLEPLGVTSFPPVKLSALCADPLAPEGALFDWELWVCSAEESRCDLAGTRTLVKAARSKLDAIEVDFRLESNIYLASILADPLKGFGGVPVMVELRVQRETFSARAVKRIVYGAPIPPQKTPNQNPSLARITADGAPITAELPASAGGEKIKLLPEPAAGAKEKYWVLTYTGGERELDEYLSYAFFTTDGGLSDATTGGKPSPFVEKKKVEDPSSDWSPPAEPGTIDLYLVVRDDRGGVGWTTLRAVVK
jgi:hypothetical protein